MYGLIWNIAFFFNFREFCKRMNADLPFCYWTLNERYSEESYPSFDIRPEFDEDGNDAHNHPLRLQTAHQSERRQLHLCSWKSPSPCSTLADHPSVILQARKLPCLTPVRWLVCTSQLCKCFGLFLFSFAIIAFHDYVCKRKENKNPTKNKLKSQYR